MKFAVAVLCVAIFLSQNVNALNGWAKTTRYWDCCKPSCSWSANVRNTGPVRSCDKGGWRVIEDWAKNGCEDGGWGYMCNHQVPWSVNNNLAYGFAAASFQGGVDNNRCCACFRLDFQGQLSGKQMIVQVTNTGGDLGNNHFDLSIPGGGVGWFQRGCNSQWGAPWDGWGQRYGGVGSWNDCWQLPEPLRGGCRFRFEWMQGVSNPDASFTQVQCPRELTDKTGCQNNQF